MVNSQPIMPFFSDKLYEFVRILSSTQADVVVILIRLLIKLIILIID